MTLPLIKVFPYMKFHFNSIVNQEISSVNECVTSDDADADADVDHGQSDPFVSAFLKQVTQKASIQ